MMRDVATSTKQTAEVQKFSRHFQQKARTATEKLRALQWQRLSLQTGWNTAHHNVQQLLELEEVSQEDWSAAAAPKFATTGASLAAIITRCQDLAIHAKHVQLENELDGQQLLLSEHHMYNAFHSALAAYRAAQQASQSTQEQEARYQQQVQEAESKVKFAEALIAAYAEIQEPQSHDQSSRLACLEALRATCEAAGFAVPSKMKMLENRLRSSPQVNSGRPCPPQLRWPQSSSPDQIARQQSAVTQLKQRLASSCGRELERIFCQQIQQTLENISLLQSAHAKRDAEALLKAEEERKAREAQQRLEKADQAQKEEMARQERARAEQAEKKAALQRKLQEKEAKEQRMEQLKQNEQRAEREAEMLEKARQERLQRLQHIEHLKALATAQLHGNPQADGQEQPVLSMQAGTDPASSLQQNWHQPLDVGSTELQNSDKYNERMSPKEVSLDGHSIVDLQEQLTDVAGEYIPEAEREDAVTSQLRGAYCLPQKISDGKDEMQPGRHESSEQPILCSAADPDASAAIASHEIGTNIVDLGSDRPSSQEPEDKPTQRSPSLPAMDEVNPEAGQGKKLIEDLERRAQNNAECLVVRRPGDEAVEDVPDLLGKSTPPKKLILETQRKCQSVNPIIAGFSRELKQSPVSGKSQDNAFDTLPAVNLAEPVKDKEANGTIHQEGSCPAHHTTDALHPAEVIQQGSKEHGAALADSSAIDDSSNQIEDQKQRELQARRLQREQSKRIMREMRLEAVAQRKQLRQIEAAKKAEEKKLRAEQRALKKSLSAKPVKRANPKRQVYEEASEIEASGSSEEDDGDEDLWSQGQSKKPHQSGARSSAAHARPTRRSSRLSAVEQGVEELKAEMELLKQKMRRKSSRVADSNRRSPSLEAAGLHRSESMASFHAPTPDLISEKRRTTTRSTIALKPNCRRATSTVVRKRKSETAMSALQASTEQGCSRSLPGHLKLFQDAKRQKLDLDAARIPHNPIEPFVTATLPLGQQGRQRGSRPHIGDDPQLSTKLKTRQADVRFGRSPVHAWGLFAKTYIQPEEIIIEYIGEVISVVLSEIREREYNESGLGSSYLFRVDDDIVVDATKQGGLARYINHSCSPNCYTRIVLVNGKKHIVIVSRRLILPGQELFYDYKFPIEEDQEAVPCHCGAPNCRGRLN